MSYIKKTWVSQDEGIIMESKYYSKKYKPVESKPKERRTMKINMTSELQQEINQRQRVEKLTRLIADNFHRGDLYLTFTYEHKPKEADEVKKDKKSILDKIRRIYKRLGEEMKSISIIENLDGGGRPHIHMLINKPEGIDADELHEIIEEKWTKSEKVYKEIYGVLYPTRMENAAKMAAYFAKETKKGKKRGILSPSRNLVRTEPKKKKVKRADAFDEKAHPPKGYHVVKSLSYTGYTSEGYPYIRYVYEKDREKPKDKRKAFFSRRWQGA